METIVYAEIYVSGCFATLTLNGIPILSTGRRGGVFSSMGVRQLLLIGSNRLELVVEPVVEPSLAPFKRRKLTLADQFAIGRLVRYEEGVETLAENGDVLLEHVWEADGLEDTYPKILSKEVHVPDAKHRWDWESAPQLVLGPELEAEAIAVIESVADSIRRNDLDTFMELTSAKLKDALTAYPARSEEMNREELTGFLAFWQKMETPIIPLNQEAHDFRIVAGGRMLEAVDKDGLASLRFNDPNDPKEMMPYPLYLARLDGRLRVIR